MICHTDTIGTQALFHSSKTDCRHSPQSGNANYIRCSVMICHTDTIGTQALFHSSKTDCRHSAQSGNANYIRCSALSRHTDTDNRNTDLVLQQQNKLQTFCSIWKRKLYVLQCTEPSQNTENRIFIVYDSTEIGLLTAYTYYKGTRKK